MESSQIRCSECGAMNRAGASRCKRCKSDLALQIAPVQAPAHQEGQLPATEDYLAQILGEQKRQTEHLGRINTAATVFLVMVILSAIGWCLVTFLGVGVL